MAKDDSCMGYWPGGNEEEACKDFGLEMEQCFITKVIWTGEEFVEINQVIQPRLL